MKNRDKKLPFTKNGNFLLRSGNTDVAAVTPRAAQDAPQQRVTGGSLPLWYIILIVSNNLIVNVNRISFFDIQTLLRLDYNNIILVR